MYEESNKLKNVKRLPLSLPESLDLLKNNLVLNKAFGKKIIQSYLTLKNREMESYRQTEGSSKTHSVTKWEKDNTLDC